MRDSKGETWFVSFDARGYPEAATGAILVANKIFWTLGYWQAENYLATTRRENLVIAETATIRPPSGRRRQMTASDLDDVLKRAHRSADGSYRAIAARALPGRPVSGFFYYGTRSDDPNDVVPHEHRRELRALKVFGAWTNLVDMKAGNTLDTVITENGRSVVRHYLQDVGSTFGTGANGLREFDEGWEYLFEGNQALKRLVSFGFALSPWQTVDYEKHDSIGRFEGDVFQPSLWKPRVPTAAFRHARPDDGFWAARRVMAFSDAMIRAVVATGEYSDPAAGRYLADVLIKRRNAIGREYLAAINPVTDPALDNAGTLTFRNAALDAGVAAAPGELPRGLVRVRQRDRREPSDWEHDRRHRAPAGARRLRRRLEQFHPGIAQRGGRPQSFMGASGSGVFPSGRRRVASRGIRTIAGVGVKTAPRKHESTKRLRGCLYAGVLAVAGRVLRRAQ